jgi:hypothetical protein
MDKAKRDHGLAAIYAEIQRIACGDVTQDEFAKALGNIK